MKASREVVITINNGLHARPAMQFVDLANQFQSNIRVEKLDEEPVEADGKSVMSMITLIAPRDTRLRITAEGEDAPQAVAKLAALLDEIAADENQTPAQ